MSGKQFLTYGHFIFARESGLYLLQIIHHHIKVVAFYEIRSSLLHGIWYGLVI